MASEPNLSALRVFVTAARQGSFRAAAEELNASVGSVSRFIALLEAQLGVRLFTRAASGASLTPDGKRLFGKLAPAFDVIAQATEEIATASDSLASVSIWAMPTFGAEWLLPRVKQIKRKHGIRSVRLDLAVDLPRSRLDEIDLGIAPVPEMLSRHPSVRSVFLYREVYFPVCSPAFADGARSSLSRKGLCKLPFLVSQHLVADWKAWLTAYDVRGVRLEDASIFESSTAAYRAARDGFGIALGERINVAQALERKELVVPIKWAIASKRAVELIIPPGGRRRRALKPLMEFIQHEIRASERIEAIEFCRSLSAAP